MKKPKVERTQFEFTGNYIVNFYPVEDKNMHQVIILGKSVIYNEVVICKANKTDALELLMRAIG